MIKINDFNLTRNFNFTELPCLRYTWSHHYRSGGVEKRRNETEKVRERETKRHSSWRTVSSIHRARDTRCEIRGFSRYVCLYGAIIKMTSRKRKVTRRAIKENRKLKTRETVIDLYPYTREGVTFSSRDCIVNSEKSLISFSTSRLRFAPLFSHFPCAVPNGFSY